MPKDFSRLLRRIKALEAAIAARLKSEELRVGFKLKGRRVCFDARSAREHRMRRRTVWQGLRDSPWPNLAVAPVVYAGIVPALLMDAFATAYQAVCFPVFKIARVARGDFISLDRGRLPYLNWVERINCDYCAYFNGVVAFTRELASRTEQYFCPIRHALKTQGLDERQLNFLPYGDGRDYQARLKRLQKALMQA